MIHNNNPLGNEGPAPIAQGIEQGPSKTRVEGSNPSGSAGLSPPGKDSLHRVFLVAADVRIKDWAAAICREGGSVCRSSSHLHPYIDAASG